MQFAGFERLASWLSGVACALLVCAAALAHADEPPSAVPPAESAPTDQGARIEQLIAQLGEADYFVRERAQQELAKIGFEAFDALEAAAENEDLEIAARAKYLMRQMQIEWTVDSDPPEVKRLLHHYALKDEAAHLALLEQLADLPGEKGLPVLCRLVRFDKSLVLSKLAAIGIVEQRVPAERWNDRERVITECLGRSLRPAAEWLRAYVASHRDPTAAAQWWAKLAEAEEQTLSQQPHQTQSSIVMSLWRQQVALLKQMDRRDEAVAAMMRIVNLEEGASDTLAELLDWLVRQEAWKVVDTVAARFADRIEREPSLLYSLAEAQLKQGQEELAQQTADKALKLNDGKQLQHLVVADELRRRGMLKWAQQEFRHAIESGQPGHPVTVAAQLKLAEILHDRADDLAAAKLREDAVLAREAKEKDGDDQNMGETFGSLQAMRARMHFFRACHHEAGGDRVRQLEELKAGLDQDPTDADVLIALYRYPDLDAELKEQTRRLIRQAVEEFRRQIRETPEEPAPYNQVAWLIANTEGNKKEALASSEKSLELVRSVPKTGEVRFNEAGYLDTLARCHFALGDFESAVKYQTKAVELDPHSGQMNRQLDEFRAALRKAETSAP